MMLAVGVRCALRPQTGKYFAHLAGGVAGLAAALLAGAGEVEAKTPGERYCFLGVCHRVKTLAETRALLGRTEVVHASYYYEAGRDRFNPSNITSSGEYFQASRPDNAASPVLPNGTKLLVWHPITKQAVVVRINNAGPYWGRRTLDLSRAAAERLGMAASGVATVLTRVLEVPTPQEATYRRGRTYPPVPGFLGAFGSIDLAHLGAARRLGQPLPGGDTPARALEIASGELMPPPEMGHFVVAAHSQPVVLALPSPGPRTLALSRAGVPPPAVRVAAGADKPASSRTKPASARIVAATPVGRAQAALQPPRPAAARGAPTQVRLSGVNQPPRVQVAALPKRAPAGTVVAAAPNDDDRPAADSGRWVSNVLTLQRHE